MDIDPIFAAQGNKEFRFDESTLLKPFPKNGQTEFPTRRHARNLNTFQTKEVYKNEQSNPQDSNRRHYEMIEMAAYKDSLAKQLNKEANDIKERLKK